MDKPPEKGKIIQFPNKNPKPEGTLADRFFPAEAQASVGRMLWDLATYEARLAEIKSRSGNRIKPATLENFNRLIEQYRHGLMTIQDLPLDTPTASKILVTITNTSIDIERKLAELEQLVGKL